MEKNGKASTMSLALGMILVAALTRLIPHAPNFTAVTAMALFAGVTLQNRWLALVVPLAALAITDVILGSYAGILYVYLPFALIALASFQFLKNRTWVQLGGASLAASLFFFVVSNFGVWLTSGMYVRSFQGLVTCYVMALPFLGNQIVGDLFFSAVLLGAFALLKKSLVADSSRAL